MRARLTSIALVTLLGAGCYATHERGSDAGARDAGRRFDAGAPPDAGEPLGCPAVCSEHAVRWRWDGGLRASETRHELSPCRRVLRTIDRFGGALPTTCVEQLGDTACEPLRVVNRVLASERFAELRARAPIVLGGDSRPSDGAVFELEVGGAIVALGDNCAGRPGCEDVDPELRDLQDALLAIEAALEEPGRCADEQPAVTFPCGEGDDRISCVTSRDVCYLDRPPEPLCSPPPPGERVCDGPLRCECLVLSLAETCMEAGPEELRVRFVGP